MYWFTSDQHFGHKNIIKYVSRDFNNVTEMDEALIKAWNSVVEAKDTVYHLGDFSLQGDVQKYFSRLNGNIYILGMLWHHDRAWLKKDSQVFYKKSFVSNVFHTRDSFIQVLEPLLTMAINKTQIVLCHFPMESWDKQHYGSWHLHGHRHSKVGYTREASILDIGVDNVNKLTGSYRPISFEEIKKVFNGTYVTK